MSPAQSEGPQKINAVRTNQADENTFFLPIMELLLSIKYRREKGGLEKIIVILKRLLRRLRGN
jgi:hypothetical protein